MKFLLRSTPNSAAALLVLELTLLLDVPMGLRTVGYSESDVPSLVQGTLPQHRVTKISPRPVGEKELEALFLDALDA